MKVELQLTVSIVLYEHRAFEIKGLISSILNARLNVQIYLIDNSSSDQLKRLAADNRIVYRFNNKNLGYGKGHNVAIFESIKIGCPYHLIINPDVEFEGEILEQMYCYMEKNPDVGCVVPKVLYPSGVLQHLNKLYPTPFDLIMRRFVPNKVTNLSPRLKRYELKQLADEAQVPVASGCFLYCRNEVLKKLNGFDPRYFMYLEDTDLCRRINSIAKVIYYPQVEVIHGYAKGSYTSPKLLWYHIVSAFKYFNKWGWFIDRERIKVNRQFS